METFWLAVTQLGRDEVFIVALTLYTLLVNPQGGRNLGVMFALSYLTNTALKYGLDLPRPFTHNPHLASAAAQATAGGPGLPSGHAQLGATLWLGMAALQRRPLGWWLAGGLVALVAYSRLALHVHYPSDVLTGLLLGLAFALASRLPLAAWTVWERWLALLPIMAALLLPHWAPRELSAGLGMLAGFWVARPNFAPPRDWTGRLLVGLLGLALVFGTYLLLGLLPHSLKDLPLMRALRYAALVLVATQAVPFLLRRWLPIRKPVNHLV